MASLTNMLIGFVVFALIATIMFNAAGTVGETYSSKDYNTYQNLGASYNKTMNSGTNGDSLPRKLQNQTNSGVLSTIFGVFDNGIKAAKLIGDSVGTTTDIANQINNDTGNYVDKTFIYAIMGIFTITLLLMGIYFAWRGKAES